MGAFEYTALDSKGRETKGVLEGDTFRQIRQSLREQGMVPLSVDEVQPREERGGQQNALFRRGVSATDLALITRQLATLVRSGLPVEEALRAVSQQTEKARMKSMLVAVRSRVMEGHALAAALSDFPHVFPELYRSTVAAGEQSGHLNVVLDRLADYTESRHQLNQKMMLALIYPLLLTLVAIGVVVGLLAYVVPQVVSVFDNVGQSLPALTVGLITVSDIVHDYGLFMLVIIVAAILLFNYLMRFETARFQFHVVLLKIPLVSRLVRGLNTARFARTFSILAASGVPVLDGLRISAQVIENLPMRQAVDQAARKVREGTNLHTALEASGYFPPMMLHLIASGEASGNLEEMLERAAISQEGEMDTLRGALLGIFEPVIILVMGAIVLVIVIAILLPIFELNQLVQ
jgi:general secretion pathway protein F